jgi:hypothetical protein
MVDLSMCLLSRNSLTTPTTVTIAISSRLLPFQSYRKLFYNILEEWAAEVRFIFVCVL